MNGYRTHVPRIISAFRLEPLITFPHLARFVLATIQQQFHTVPAILDDWERNGDGAETMWGMKRDGWHFLNDAESWHPVALQLLAAVESRDRVMGIDACIAIPGINTVKASFLAQLVGLETACLDTQNCKLYGINNVQAFAIRPSNTAKTRLAKIESYLTLCDKLGDSEYHWNTWCDVIAGQYSQHFDMGFDVSSMHIEQTLGRFTATDRVPF